MMQALGKGLPIALGNPLPKALPKDPTRDPATESFT